MAVSANRATTRKSIETRVAMFVTIYELRTGANSGGEEQGNAQEKGKVSALHGCSLDARIDNTEDEMCSVSELY